MIRHLLALGSLVTCAALVGSCGDALGPGDCPDAATNLVLKPFAPFWGGLVEVDFKVPGGAPEAFDVELFDPAEKLWEPLTSPTVGQRDDGSYAAEVGPLPVSRLNASMERKVRLRPRLQGCPVPDWATTKGFTLGDPLVGTSWVLDPTVPPNGNVSVQSLTGSAYKGPFSLGDDPPLSLSVTFLAGGVVHEELKFSLASATAADPYDGCSFDLRFTGSYVVVPEQGQVAITNLVRAAHFADGSVCGAPALATMSLLNPQIGGPSQDGESLVIDYSQLAASPPGHAMWSASFLYAPLQAAAQLISVPTVSSVQINAYGPFSYAKQ
jgi:hypothetical protein